MHCRHFAVVECSMSRILELNESMHNVMCTIINPQYMDNIHGTLRMRHDYKTNNNDAEISGSA